MSTLTIQQITNQSLRLLEKEFSKVYKPMYKMWSSYGKYHISKTEWIDGGLKTTMVARRLSKEEAEGFMKLLKESDDER